jgi:hypothetical protein
LAGDLRPATIVYSGGQWITLYSFSDFSFNGTISTFLNSGSYWKPKPSSPYAQLVHFCRVSVPFYSRLFVNFIFVNLILTSPI